jgi:hypothetical protein
VFGQQQSGAFVLLPIYTTQAVGAYGSHWETEFAVRNDTPTPIAFTTLACLFVCSGMTDLAPGTSARHNPIFPASSSFEGRLMHFDRADLSGISFSLRVRDVSRSMQSAGTEIPVVREEELRTRVSLIDIPAEQRFRHSLRIYDASHGSQVRVRIFPFQGNTAVVDEMITLLQHGDTATVPAQIGLHGLTSIYPVLTGIERFRIDVDAVSDTQRIWAFVSITNNETQEFTVVTAQ